MKKVVLRCMMVIATGFVTQGRPAYARCTGGERCLHIQSGPVSVLSLHPRLQAKALDFEKHILDTAERYRLGPVGLSSTKNGDAINVAFMGGGGESKKYKLDAIDAGTGEVRRPIAIHRDIEARARELAGLDKLTLDGAAIRDVLDRKIVPGKDAQGRNVITGPDGQRHIPDRDATLDYDPDKKMYRLKTSDGAETFMPAE